MKMFDKIVQLEDYSTPRFYTMVEKHNIWDGLDIVEQSDRTLLEEYFEREYIGTSDEADWLWLWKRRVLKWYPLYLDEKNAWLERKDYKWFWDNQTTRKLTHDEEGTRNYKLDATSKTTMDSDTTTTSTDTGSSDDKSRGFSFAYPESNYSGGVIPYDLNNDPNVEFISTQGDNVSRENHEDEHSGKSVTDMTSDTTKADTYSSDNTRDYVDTWDARGNDLADILPKIMAGIEASDYFNRFINKLKPLFLNILLTDEL